MGHQLGECTEKHGDTDLEVMAECISDGGEGLGGPEGAYRARGLPAE